MKLTRRKFLVSLAAMAGAGLAAACVRTQSHSAPTERRPIPDVTDELRLLVLGDWGTGKWQQRAVAEGMHNASRELGGFHAGLLLGDNFYPSGVTGTADTKWQTHFRQVYDTSELGNITWHAVLGNHDWLGDVQAQIDYSASDPHWSMPGHYWRQDFAPASAVSLTVLGIDTDPHFDSWGDQMVWLESQLQATQMSGRPRIVIGHHPIYSYSRHGPEPHVVRDVKPLLERYAAQAYLCGHDHNTQVMEKNNVLYAVLGGGGAGLYDTDSGVLTKFCAVKHGFGVLRVDQRKLTLECRDLNGVLLYASALQLA